MCFFGSRIFASEDSTVRTGAAEKPCLDQKILAYVVEKLLRAKRINVFFLDQEFSHQKISLYAPALLKSPVWTKNPRIRGGKVASRQNAVPE